MVDQFIDVRPGNERSLTCSCCQRITRHADRSRPGCRVPHVLTMTIKTTRTLGLFGMMIILFMGYALRVQQLNRFPPGLSTDEASGAIDGLQISRHGIYPLYEDFGRPDPLYEIVIAAGVAVFGPSIFVIRLMNVWIGLITLACACWAARQMLPGAEATGLKSKD